LGDCFVVLNDFIYQTGGSIVVVLIVLRGSIVKPEGVLQVYCSFNYFKYSRIGFKFSSISFLAAAKEDSS
jgi:hypothetical protein